MRTCAGCRLCCKLFPVPALGKPAGQWCAFNDHQGCSVHAGHRPPACGAYACYWLEQELLDDRLRPDRIGTVISDDGVFSVQGDLVRVFRFNLADSGVRASGILETVLAEFVERGAAVMLLNGPEAEWCYDRRRYADLLPEHFEAAYRLWIAEDARELVRLGTVPEGFLDSVNGAASPAPQDAREGLLAQNRLLNDSTKELAQ